MLRRLRCDVDAVAGGESALAACAETDYDLVLIDYEMPQMDGVTAATRIRTLDREKARHTHMIIVTGSDPRPFEQTALFDGLVRKPFVLDELRLCMQSVLGLQS